MRMTPRLAVAAALLTHTLGFYTARPCPIPTAAIARSAAVMDRTSIAAPPSPSRDAQFATYVPLTRAEEMSLARGAALLARLEAARDAYAEAHARPPSSREWAAACGYANPGALAAALKRSRACRDALISRNVRLAVKVARKYTTSGMAFGDLVQEGVFGLAKAADRFDPDRGFRFSTYAVWWIRQAISHAVNQQERTIRLPTHVLDALRRYDREKEALSASQGRDPTRAELSEALDADASRMRKWEAAARTSRTASTDAALGATTTTTRSSLIADDAAAEPERVVGEAALAGEVAEVLKTLDGRLTYQVVARHYGLDGRPPESLRSIATSHGLTRERVRQIRAAALDELRRPPSARRLAPYVDFSARTGVDDYASRDRPNTCADFVAGDRLTERITKRTGAVAEVKKGGWLHVVWDDEPDEPKFARPTVFERIVR